MDTKYNELGYLHEEFQIFHLGSALPKEVPFHYHDFRKILICLSRNTGYLVEGKHYELHPSDIIFVDAGEIHRPIVNNKEYERIIIYISPDFSANYTETNLTWCFEESKRINANIYRGNKELSSILINKAMAMSTKVCYSSIAPNLLQKCRLVEFLILLNDFMQHDQEKIVRPTSSNTIIMQIIDYISAHLAEDISIHSISEHVHINKSYLMHKFKAETGYTIKEYITEKRLFKARYLLQQRLSMTDACYTSGFTNYTSFYRAYKKRYGFSPRNDMNKDTMISDIITLE